MGGKSLNLSPALDGVVAQLVEHHNGIVGVAGSIPVGSTILQFILNERSPTGGPPVVSTPVNTLQRSGSPGPDSISLCEPKPTRTLFPPPRGGFFQVQNAFEHRPDIIHSFIYRRRHFIPFGHPAMRVASLSPIRVPANDTFPLIG